MTPSRRSYCLAWYPWQLVDIAVHVIIIEITLGGILGICGFTKVLKITWVHEVVVDTPAVSDSLGSREFDDGVARTVYQVLL